MREFDSTDRTTIDYVLFALAFLGFTIAVAAIIVTFLPFVCAGALILFLAFLGLNYRSED